MKKDILNLPPDAWLIKLSGDELLFTPEHARLYMEDIAKGATLSVIDGRFYSTKPYYIVPVIQLQDQEHLHLGHKLCENLGWHWYDEQADVYKTCEKSCERKFFSPQQAYRLISQRTAKRVAAIQRKEIPDHAGA